MTPKVPILIVNKEPFHDIKLMFQRFDLWPSRDIGRLSRLKYVIPTILFFYTPLVLYLLFCYENLIEHLTAFAESLAGIVFWTKFLSIHYYKDELSDIFARIDESWQKSRREGGQKRTLNLAICENENTKLFNWIFYGFCVTASHYVWTPMISFFIQKNVLNWDLTFAFGSHS